MQFNLAGIVAMVVGLVLLSFSMSYIVDGAALPALTLGVLSLAAGYFAWRALTPPSAKVDDDADEAL